jgi:hypothetical protein
MGIVTDLTVPEVRLGLARPLPAQRLAALRLPQLTRLFPAYRRQLL